MSWSSLVVSALSVTVFLRSCSAQSCVMSYIVAIVTSLIVGWAVVFGVLVPTSVTTMVSGDDILMY